VLGRLGAMRAYNKLSAAFMFVLAGGCLLFATGAPSDEGGAAATAFWLVFAVVFAGLGVFALRQR
jgi:hypothetical protein